MTRLQTLRTQGLQPEMPPLEGGEHLIDWLLDAGPIEHTAMGPAPITHASIAAWQANQGMSINAWSAQTLRRLSADYVDALRDAKAHDAPAPYIAAERPAEQRKHVARGLAGFFSRIAAPAGAAGANTTRWSA